MKCSARLIYYKKTTKTGKRRLYRSLPCNWNVIEWFKSTSKVVRDKLDLTHIETCGGKIIAEIGSHSEPIYNEAGDEYPAMHVNFICKECKQYSHPGLPREETALNEWLTEIIERM